MGVLGDLRMRATVLACDGRRTSARHDEIRPGGDISGIAAETIIRKAVVRSYRPLGPVGI